MIHGNETVKSIILDTIEIGLIRTDDQTIKKKRCQYGNCRRFCHSYLSTPCRCSKIFCNSHTVPRKHECNFDYKTFYREHLSKNNPRIGNLKINKI